MATNPTRPRAWMADDNQDVDPKPGTQDPKGTQTRRGVVEPKPLSADPPDEDTKQDPGPKADRGGKVKAKKRG